MTEQLSVLSRLIPQFDGGREIAGGKFALRCPYCGDSKNPKKSHANFFRSTKHGTYLFHCYKCGKSRSFFGFLKDFAPEELRHFDFGRSIRRTTDPQEEKSALVAKAAPAPKFLSFAPAYQNIKGVPADTMVMGELGDFGEAYFAKRRVAYDAAFGVWDAKGYYEGVTGKRAPVPPETRGVVLPCFSPGREYVIGFVLRTLSDDPGVLRYLTATFNETPKMVFGLDRLDLTKRVYVVEGAYDALSLTNTMAALNAQLATAATDVFEGKGDVVVLHDNEPEKPQIKKEIMASIDAGHQIVLFPKRWPKDINDMVLEHGREKVLDYIGANVVSGITAKRRFLKWTS